MFENYDFLDSKPYYCLNADPGRCFSDLTECLQSLGANRRIDPVAVLGILMKNYPLATRTLVQGVERTPWMGLPDGTGCWAYAELPRHGNLSLSSREIALELIRRLKKEATAFLSGKKTVGILLSGGMDSRVVAGIVRSLQNSGDYTGQAVALAWGVAGSRDVVYAHRLANKFGWDFVHFPLSAEVLHQNIVLAAERGAEYSPVHLHAMSQVAATEGLDGILAGSYGDSIGRGEYSGRHVSRLPDILVRHLNLFALMRKDFEKNALTELRRDLNESRELFPDRSETAYREIEMQMHYMRRQLRVCMDVIGETVPLYQMFTSPDVFGFVWSLSLECRTDHVYRDLLSELSDDLLQVPWARNGKPYGQSRSESADSLFKLNNRYGEWLRRDCRSFVLKRIESGHLQKMGIFNERSLEMWMKKWPVNDSPKADRLDEKMAWLASLSIFIEKYGVSGFGQNQPLSLGDSAARRWSLMHTWVYHQALKKMRK